MRTRSIRGKQAGQGSLSGRKRPSGSNSITVSGISDELLHQLEAFAEASGQAGKSQVVRDALTVYLAHQAPNRAASETDVWNGIRSRASTREIKWSQVASSRDQIYD